MNKAIVTENPAPRNPLYVHAPTPEAPCPRCGRETTFSNTTWRVRCLSCGWALRIPDEDQMCYLSAVLGYTRMDRGAYLAALAPTPGKAA
jgi:hypothetical protein